MTSTHFGVTNRSIENYHLGDASVGKHGLALQLARAGDHFLIADNILHHPPLSAFRRAARRFFNSPRGRIVLITIFDSIAADLYTYTPACRPVTL